MLVFITSSGDEQKHHFQFLPVLYSLSIYILRWHDTRRRIEVFLGGFWSWKMIGEKKCLSPTTVKFWLYYYLSKLTTCGQSVRPILREVSEIQLRNSLPDCLSLTINNYIVFTKKNSPVQLNSTSSSSSSVASTTPRLDRWPLPFTYYYYVVLYSNHTKLSTIISGAIFLSCTLWRIFTWTHCTDRPTTNCGGVIFTGKKILLT